MNKTQLASLAVAESQLSQLTANEYRDSILEHMIRVDSEQRPDPTMIDQQPEISWHWWPILVNMMVDMHTRLNLEPQTLFLAVNIVNRYCSRRIVYQKHFRLVGITAMWIASKYEDKKSSVPTLHLLRHMSSDHYSEEMFLMMEGHILSTLDWCISHCTVDSFLRVLISAGNASPLLSSLTNYIAEITLYHKVFVGENPLIIAQAIHMLSLHLLNVNTPIVPDETGAQWQQWIPTLADIIISPPPTLLEKYQSPERLSVARVVDSWVLRRQRQAQEEAAAKARAHAKAEAQQQLRFNILSQQVAGNSLPLTPPPSATKSSPHSESHAYAGSDFTPPNSATLGPCNDSDAYNDSPLTMHSLASLTSLSSVTSLNSVSSIAPQKYGLFQTTNSPPTTPLNPPKPCFRV